MKRIDFFKEMGTSFLQTVKYAYEPFIHDDLQKVEDVMDRALGVKWLPFMKEEEAAAAQLEMKFIDGRPVILSNCDSNIQVMDGICPGCLNLINVTALYSTGKCLYCEKEFNFKTKQGDLVLESLPLKTKDHVIYIGLNKQKNLGGSRA